MSEGMLMVYRSVLNAIKRMFAWNRPRLATALGQGLLAQSLVLVVYAQR